MKLEPNEASTCSDIEHLRPRVSGLTDATSDLLNDIVWLIEVDATSPFIVACRRQSIVKLANVVIIWIVLGELVDCFVADGSLFTFALVGVARTSLGLGSALVLLRGEVDHHSEGETTRRKHVRHAAA